MERSLEEKLEKEIWKEQKRHSRLQDFFIQAPAAMAVLNGPTHVYTLSNPLYERLFNRTREQLLGQQLHQVYPEIEDQGIFELLDKVYETGESFNAQEFKVRFDRKGEGSLEDGYFNFTIHPIKNSEAKTTDVMVHAFEVTEQVLAKQKLEESEKRYQELIHTSPSMIAIYKGRDMIVEMANDAMLKTWGKGREVIGKPLFEILPEIGEQGYPEMLHSILETGVPHESYQQPATLIRNGKKYKRYYNLISYPQKDLDGKVTGIYHIATDVTPEAEMKRKIQESEAHFRQMADLLPEKITNNDPQGKPIYFNRAWLDFLGFSSEELVNKSWDDFIHPHDLDRILPRWQHSLATGADYEVEFRIRGKNCDYIWQLSRGTALKDEEGNIKYWITTTIDIQKLKEEDQRKEDFLKMVSHELKTPLTSIKGYVQLLLGILKSKKGGELPDSIPMKPSLERISHQVNRLTRLISEILDLSRVKEDRLELKTASFSINELVEETVQDINLTNPQHQLRITHDFRCSVTADRDRIGQVLINFITNAIKYSPQSREVKLRVQEGPHQQVVVSVKDKGIGIAKEDQEKIFRRFHRIGIENEDTYSGFGIGLFLAKEIVERHQGKITVESEPGEGSEFSFFLPYS